MPIRPEWWAVAAAACVTLGVSVLRARMRRDGRPAARRSTWAWLALPAFPILLVLDEYRVRVIFRASGGAFDGVRVLALVPTTCGLASILLRHARWAKPAGTFLAFAGLVALASVAAFGAAFWSIR